VGAGAARRDADLDEPLVDVDDAVERHPMDLDVLARRDVGDATAVAVGDLRQALHLLGRQRPAGDLDALHVARVGELVGAPRREPDRPALVGAQLAFAEALRPAPMAGKRGEMLITSGSHVWRL